MTRKEIVKLEKENTHPLRWKMITLGVPLYVLLAIFGTAAAVLVDVFVMGSEESPGWLSFVGIGWFVVLSVFLVLLSERITKLEMREALQQYAYLFESPTPITEEKILPEGLDEGIYCALTKEGFYVRTEEKCDGQVFDEVSEDTFFVDWAHADYFLVTQNMYHRVHIGLAVVLPDDAEERFFVVPMQKKVYDGLYAFAMNEKIARDLAFLRFNLPFAFKHILATGTVLKQRDPKTKKKITIENEEVYFKD